MPAPFHLRAGFRRVLQNRNWGPVRDDLTFNGEAEALAQSKLTQDAAG